MRFLRRKPPHQTVIRSPFEGWDELDRRITQMGWAIAVFTVVCVAYMIFTLWHLWVLVTR